MPLFDPDNAFSTEAPAIYHLADRLSESAAFQRLCGAADAAAALAKVRICEELEPWDNPDGPIRVAQLLEIACVADLAPDDEVEHEASRAVGDPWGKCPNETGAAELRLIWWPPEVWVAEYGKKEVYLYFLDLVSRISQELHLRADASGKPILRSVRRQGRPKWNNPKEQSSQGRHLWAVLIVEWGDGGGEE